MDFCWPNIEGGGDNTNSSNKRCSLVLKLVFICSQLSQTGPMCVWVCLCEQWNWNYDLNLAPPHLRVNSEEESFIESCCIFVSFYHVVLLICSWPSFLSSMPTSQCLTMWASRVCSLSWSTKMITGPSSANRCTTSAFRKTQLLVLHCSASWWVLANTRAEFVVIYFWNSDYNISIFPGFVLLWVYSWLVC